MEKIYIPHLMQREQQSVTIEFEQNIADLTSLTPVQGVATVTHHGNYLQVGVQAKTIVTLSCDRCLQQYNHRLVCDASEMIWLKGSALLLDDLPLDMEMDIEEVVENLPEDGHFEVETWIYEQLCLALPQRKLCDVDCPGIDLPKPNPEDLVDRRWAALMALKNQLPDIADS
ncbi:MAG: hypothetical protein RLZZ511_699 [Cyanobacteriota bacterium]|jgi:uncharacterized protein